MRKLITFTALFVSLAVALSARADIIIPQTSVTFDGTSPGYELTIVYEVTLNAGLYTYSYDLSTSPAEPLSSFTIGGNPDPIDTQSVVITAYGGADTLLSGATGNSIVFQWDFNSGITSADVSYTSVNGPRLASFVLNDDDIGWTSPPGIPAPTPVPEASTIFAGLLTILPLGFGAFRAWRKDR
jgi:hypothetical protein